MDCQIRHWQQEDAAALAEALSNKKVQKNLRDGIPYPYTEKDAGEYIRAMLSADPSSTFAFAITSEDKVIGSIGVFRQQNIHYRTAELGYYIAEPFWGKGFGSSAVGQICRHVFEHTDIIRIFAEPFSYNLASCRILEKNNFQLEGILHQNAEKDGKILDMNLYSLLRKQNPDISF